MIWKSLIALLLFASVSFAQQAPEPPQAPQKWEIKITVEPNKPPKVKVTEIKAMEAKKKSSNQFLVVPRRFGRPILIQAPQETTTAPMVVPATRARVRSSGC